MTDDGISTGLDVDLCLILEWSEVCLDQERRLGRFGIYQFLLAGGNACRPVERSFQIFTIYFSYIQSLVVL